MKKTISILGASGYTGAELLRILSTHRDIQVAAITGSSAAGTQVRDLYPHLAPYQDLRFKTEQEALPEIEASDLVFCALPHGEAMKLLPQLKTKKIIDLGGDFRLLSAQAYQQWYGTEHLAPQELGHWIYGMPELYKAQIKDAQKVANPGCFASAVTFAAAPLVKENLITPLFTASAISGLSGAGKVPKPTLHFSHASEDICAYKVTTHQHTPEIEQTLSAISGTPIRVSLTTHLAPIVRGIHVILCCECIPGITQQKIDDAFQALYHDSKFIRYCTKPPGTKEVRGSNAVAIYACLDTRLQRVIVTTVLDNLIKGASGQAIQNANLMLGLNEDEGLSTVGLYP